jgi:hypothetical protein
MAGVQEYFILCGARLETFLRNPNIFKLTYSLNVIEISR